MNRLFKILGRLAYLFGFVVLSTAKSAIHENIAVMIMLIGTVFIVGSGIISAIDKNTKQIVNLQPDKDAESNQQQ